MVYMVSASRLRTFFSWHSNNISTKHLPICQPTSTSHLGVSRNRQMSPELGFILVDHFYGASFPYLDRQNPTAGVSCPPSKNPQQWKNHRWDNKFRPDMAGEDLWTPTNPGEDLHRGPGPTGMEGCIVTCRHEIDTHWYTYYWHGLFWYESVDCFLIYMSSYNYTWLLDTYDITCHTWVIMVIVGFK